MIKATVQECREAFTALRRIGEEVRLPEKAAWRVSRLTNKLKPVVRDFEETQLKLFKDAGGVESGRGIELPAIERGKEESDADYENRLNERREAINGLNEQLRELNREAVDIDYDPLPRSLLQVKDKDGKDKIALSPNDYADLGQFIADDTEAKE